MYFINGNRDNFEFRILNFELHVFSVSREYFTTLSCTTLLLQSLKDHCDFALDFSLGAKSGAKVLLFFGPTKFLSNFFQYFLHFLRKWLIFSITFLNDFRSIFLLTSSRRENGCKGTAFLWTDQIFWQKNCYKTSLSL